MLTILHTCLTHPKHFSSREVAIIEKVFLRNEPKITPLIAHISQKPTSKKRRFVHALAANFALC